LQASFKRRRALEDDAVEPVYPRRHVSASSPDKQNPEQGGEIEDFVSNLGCGLPLVSDERLEEVVPCISRQHWRRRYVWGFIPRRRAQTLP
jgi:hypothetical protein